MLDYMLYVHIYNIYIRVDYENACDKSEVAKRVREGGTLVTLIRWSGARPRGALVMLVALVALVTLTR